MAADGWRRAVSAFRNGPPPTPPMKPTMITIAPMEIPPTIHSPPNTTTITTEPLSAATISTTSEMSKRSYSEISLGRRKKSHFRPPPPPRLNSTPGVFMDDGRHRIDFVLVYQITDSEIRRGRSISTAAAAARSDASATVAAAADRAKRRAFFETNLLKEGLIIEKDVWRRRDPAKTENNKPGAVSTTVFVKVHVPFGALCRYAERLNIKVPLKLRDAFASAISTTTTGAAAAADANEHPPERIVKIYRFLKQNSFTASIYKKFRSSHWAIFRRPTAILSNEPTSPTGSTAPVITAVAATAAQQQEPIARAATSTRTNGGGGEQKSDAQAEADEKKPPYVTHRFRRRNINMYANVEKPDEFFTPTQRIEIVWHILQKARNDEHDEKKRGIELLVRRGVYDCAFPLHDGDDDWPPEEPNEERGRGRGSSDDAERAIVDRGDTSKPKSERQFLKRTWGNWKCITHPQPLDVIRRYYGEKVAFYFAFLGFYTRMLMYPGVFGMVIFVFGLGSSEANRVVHDVCSPEIDRVMCPICLPPRCGFTNLSDGCSAAAWNYHTDSPGTFVLACFTVVWAAVFLKLWKRREAELAYEWDTYDDVGEHEAVGLRAEYELSATDRRPNPVTRELEPYIPTHKRLLRSALSTSVTLLMLSAVGASLVCLAMGRIELYRVYRQADFAYYVELGRWSVHGLIFLTVVLFDFIYSRVARQLTSLECPRTGSEWLTSFLWKVFIFEMLNDFIPICYVAWVKGKTASNPSQMTWYSEICEGGGCLGEVTELVAVLLLARLVVGNAIEIGIPFAKRIYAQTFHLRSKNAIAAVDDQSKRASTEISSSDPAARARKRWRADYLLGSLELDGVAGEYMEMVVQFAYCTLFVAALPLAPVVCFLNNILEVRIDAINLTAAHRRPLPVRVPGIGIWYNFLNIVSKLAVFSNAGLIAFTSTTVQRLHYRFYTSTNQTDPLYNYRTNSLSLYPTQNWTEDFRRAAQQDETNHPTNGNLSGCWYPDYRQDHFPYHVKREWWETMCARLVVFAMFILVSFTFQWFLNFVVSDTPTHVRLKIQRRRYVVSKATEAGGAFDLWLSKAVRRETSRQPAPGGSSTAAASDPSPSSAGPTTAAVYDEDGQHVYGPRERPVTIMLRRWKQATFGSRPSMRHSISVTRRQKTLDAVDIEDEEDI